MIKVKDNILDAITEYEKDFIVNNYKIMTDKQISIELSTITERNVKYVRELLGLRKRENKRYVFEDVEKAFNDSKYILLSDSSEFINSHSKLRYLCPDHLDKGEMFVDFGHFVKGRGCYYCGRETTINAHKIDDDIYKQRCEEVGFIFINTYIKDGRRKIDYMCKNHIEKGVFTTSASNISRLSGCPYCTNTYINEEDFLCDLKFKLPHIKMIGKWKGASKKTDFYCSIHNHKWCGQPNGIINRNGCFYCGKQALSEQHLRTTEQVNQQIHIYNPHIDLIEEYKKDNSNLLYYCHKHNKEFRRTLDGLLSRKCGCKLCSLEIFRQSQSLGLEEFKKRLGEIHPELEIRSEYINNSTPMDFYCTKHNHHFSSTPVVVLNRLKCCDKNRVTYKEEQVCQLLENWNFKITRQKVFDDCKDKRNLPFDIYLDEYDVLIEYQGEQHYRPVRYSTQTYESSNEKFLYTKRHDEIKEKYCKDNNIKLIKIPYWEFEDLEYFLFDQLVKIGIIEEIKNIA